MLKILTGLVGSFVGHVIAMGLLVAAVFGPFMLMRFDYAAYVSGTMILAIIAFIYWPRRKGNDPE